MHNKNLSFTFIFNKIYLAFEVLTNTSPSITTEVWQAFTHKPAIGVKTSSKIVTVVQILCALIDIYKSERENIFKLGF